MSTLASPSNVGEPSVQGEGSEHDEGLGLLDTSVVIQLGSVPERELPMNSLISAVTLAELTVGLLVARSEEERAVRQAVLQQAEADFDPLPFDASAARTLGRVAAALRRSGRKTTARSYDAMIAATAMANGLPLSTAIPNDLGGIDGLEVKVVGSRT